MECNWHVQNVSHNDALHNTACNLVYRVRGMKWRWEQWGTGQPGSAVILAGMGSWWYHVADKSHSSCPPKEIGDVLVLNQQLWQDISLQMSLVQPHPHPRVTCPKVEPPLTQHVLYTSLTVIFRAEQETFTPISNKGMYEWGHSGST